MTPANDSVAWRVSDQSWSRCTRRATARSSSAWSVSQASDTWRGVSSPATRVTATFHGIEKLMVTDVGSAVPVTDAYGRDMRSISQVRTLASTTTLSTSGAGGGPSSTRASTVVSR
jgi:hypothetical protein